MAFFRKAVSGGIGKSKEKPPRNPFDSIPVERRLQRFTPRTGARTFPYSMGVPAMIRRVLTLSVVALFMLPAIAARGQDPAQLTVRNFRRQSQNFGRQSPT